MHNFPPLHGMAELLARHHIQNPQVSRLNPKQAALYQRLIPKRRYTFKHLMQMLDTSEPAARSVVARLRDLDLINAERRPGVNHPSLYWRN
ncbi:hypothetical protein LQD23_21455 [Chromobacterium violaceum]|uniref:hypothetical protein n=1 Tax=Chromobacterium violaceum TaxID=536 RepID=UPI001E494499|nr:hypothetical protein [Chromobacterium violaceum]MCD0494846.1 hypothetical protein [Chromobacterium violaceum]